MDCRHDIVNCRRRILAGHILRLSRDRIAYIAIDWLLESDSKNRERPIKTWRKIFKEYLAETEVNWIIMTSKLLTETKEN